MFPAISLKTMTEMLLLTAKSYEKSKGVGEGEGARE